MIIYGTRSKHITSKKIPATCTSCEQDDMYIAVYGSYAHVMWIPFFPLGKRVYSYCGHCKNELESTAMPKELRIKARDIKSKSTTPKWFFSGSILLILIIVGEIVNGFIKEKQLPTYINAPQAGDVYYIHDAQNEYTTFKVSQIDTDSLYVTWNNYYVEKSNDIDDIDIAENYDNVSWGLSRKYIDSVHKDALILEIRR
jgi:hypothetical protein|tara:strand:+ start:5227 stop:5823 length:597 start_codon:yes stop_codon:yes gene_type:complete